MTKGAKRRWTWTKSQLRRKMREGSGHSGREGRKWTQKHPCYERRGGIETAKTLETGLNSLAYENQAPRMLRLKMFSVKCQIILVLYRKYPNLIHSGTYTQSMQVKFEDSPKDFCERLRGGGGCAGLISHTFFEQQVIFLQYRLLPDYTKPAGGKVIKTFHLEQAEGGREGGSVVGRNNSSSVLD